MKTSMALVLFALFSLIVLPALTAPQGAEEKIVFTCPMHPDVQSDKPGKCPKCGMTLEKKAMPMTHGQGGLEMQEAGVCPMMDMMRLKDAMVVSENLKDGIVLRITAKNPETVKKIQDLGAKIKAMHEPK